MICYIPSKGRPSTKTYTLFQSAGIEVLHFIEPSEYELYHVPGTKVNIGKDNQGIAYVRNFMLDYAKRHGHIHVIVCDDDVTSFGKYIDGKKIKRMRQYGWRYSNRLGIYLTSSWGSTMCSTHGPDSRISQ